MSLIQSPKYIFIPPDYDSSSPNFVQNLDLPRNLRFASKKIPLRLDNTDHGMVTIDIQYEGDINYGCVAFTQPNGLSTSVTTDSSKLFVPGNIDIVGSWSFIKDGKKTYQRFYVLVNVDPLNVSDILFVNIGLGQFTDKIPTYSSVTVLFNCPEPVYKYNMGLHVYSSYDAINSSKLRTNLYSLTPISQWGINTLVYSSEYFNNPALPYYYGFNDKVYKVGGSLNRAFGTTTYYRTVKKNAFAKVKTTTITDGPRSYYDSVNDTSPACVTPKMSDIGKIKEIILSTSLIQPLRYRYYLGYDDNIRDDSSYSVFTHYRYKTKEHLPITGSLHANIKLGSGFVNGYDSSSTDWSILFGQFGMSSLMTWNGLGNYAAVSFAIGTAVILGELLYVGARFVWFAVNCGCASAAGLLGFSTVPGIGLIFLAIAVILLIVAIFKRTVVVNKEDCKNFLHRYTPTPYMEINSLLTDRVYTNVPTGFYCDGIYYYQTNNGQITSKVPCTGLFYEYSQDENTPVKYTIQSSTIPDNPTLVTQWDKLIVLPYTSGKPEPRCNGTIYYNQLIERSVPNNCCGLEIFTDTKITILAGQEFSCISQLDANNKALALLNSSYDYATTHGNYSESISDENLGILDSKFTNVSWLEYGTTSSLVSEFTRLFFDNTDRSGLSVGKTVYFDPSGCQKALKGYYTGAPYGGSSNENPSTILINQPVKTYRIENGKIKSINDETKTKSLYQSYISNWFLTDVSLSTLIKLKELMDNSRTFNPLTLETNINCYQGLIKRKTYSDYTTVEDFLIFSGGTYIQAPEGFYLPLIDWINYDPFYYSKLTDMMLNISESCETPNNRGFYISGFNKGTNSTTPVFNAVKLEVIVKSSNGKSKTYSVTTSPTLEKTFIPYGTFFTSTDVINSIFISKILTQSPLNNFTYLIGDSSVCSTSGVSIIPCNGSFTPPQNLGPGYYEFTTTIGQTTDNISIEFNAGDTPDRIQIYWDGKLVADSLFIGNSLRDSNRQYYVDSIIKTKTLNRYVYDKYTNTWIPYITPTINVSYTLSDIASNGVRLLEDSKPSPQLGVDKYYGINISDGKIRLNFNTIKSGTELSCCKRYRLLGGIGSYQTTTFTYTPCNELTPTTLSLTSRPTLFPQDVQIVCVKCSSNVVKIGARGTVTLLEDCQGIPPKIRVVVISPTETTNWKIDKLYCTIPPNIIHFKYRLEPDNFTPAIENRYGFVFDDNRDSISFSKCGEFSTDRYGIRTAGLQIKSLTGGVPITLIIYKNNVYYYSVTLTTVVNDWTPISILLSSTNGCENTNDIYTFGFECSQPITYIARIVLSINHEYTDISGVVIPNQNYSFHIVQVLETISTSTPTPTPTMTQTPTMTPTPTNTETPTQTPTPTPTKPEQRFQHSIDIANGGSSGKYASYVYQPYNCNLGLCQIDSVFTSLWSRSSVLAIGSTLYSGQTGNLVFNGNNLWFQKYSGYNPPYITVPPKVYQISSSGVVLGIYDSVYETQAPNAVTDLTLTQKGGGTTGISRYIELSWTPVTDNDMIHHYNLYYNKPVVGETIIPTKNLAFVNGKLVRTISYANVFPNGGRYYIKSVDISNNLSLVSNEVSEGFAPW